MEDLTTDDVMEMTDVVSSQGLSPTELRIFALNQDHDIARVFISVMRNRHGIEIMN